MWPTEQQIRQAAHARWIKGGCLDGFALDDWIGAEQDLALAMNYERIAHHVLDGEPKQYIGSKTNRRCRYCGAVPPSPFRTVAHALPEFIGNKSLIAYDECDECNKFFSETVEDSLAKMLSPLRTLLLIGGKTGVPTQKANGGSFRMEYDKSVPGFAIKDTASNRVLQENVGERTMSADLGTQPYVPVRLLKCLTKMALAIMPEAELAHCRRSLEWIRATNDERWLDEVREGMTFQSFVPIVFPQPEAWLFKRTTTDGPVPAFIFCIGTSSLMLQAYIPLCALDNVWSGRPMAAPRIGHVAMSPEGPTQWSVIPVQSAALVKDTALQVVMQYDSRHEVN